MQLTLHSYRRCPFCIRSRIVLHLKNIPHKIVEEPLRKWTPWMRAWSEQSGEKARVPLLEYTHEREVIVLPESNAINLFLDAEDGDPSYTPEEGSDAYREMEEWWSWCDAELKPTIDLYKYGKDRVFDHDMHAVHTETLKKLLTKLEEVLAKKEFLLENRLTLADIAIIPFVRQIMRTRDGEFDFADFPRVEAWTLGIIKTDWFEEKVMKQYPLAETEKEEIPLP